MDLPDIVLESCGGAVSVHTVAISVDQPDTDTVIADPGDGYKIVILGGTLTGAGAASVQFHHTAGGGSNPLTASMTLASGTQYQVPPLIAPASQPVLLQAGTNHIRGSLVYAICKA